MRGNRKFYDVAAARGDAQPLDSSEPAGLSGLAGESDSGGGGFQTFSPPPAEPPPALRFGDPGWTFNRDNFTGDDGIRFLDDGFKWGTDPLTGPPPRTEQEPPPDQVGFNVTPEGQARSGFLEDRNYANWWDDPYLQFNPQGHAVSTGVNVPLAGGGATSFSQATGTPLPDYAADLGLTAETFYNTMQSSSPETRAAYIASLQSTFAAKQETIAAQERALGILSGQGEQFENQFSQWQNDPNRQHTLNELRDRSQSDYDFITEGQRAAADLQIGQNAAGNLGRAEAFASSRGVGGSSANFANQTAIHGMAQGQAMQQAAIYDSANQQFRDANLRGLGRQSLANQQVDLAYRGGLANLDSQRAAVEAGQQYEPTDFTGFAAMDFAINQARIGNEQVDRELEALIAANETDWLDILGAANDSVGSGLFKGAAGAFNQLIGGGGGHGSRGLGPNGNF